MKQIRNKNISEHKDREVVKRRQKLKLLMPTQEGLD